MSNIRIYIEQAELTGRIEIKDPQTTHKLKNVLRVTPEDCVYAFDGKGKEYLAKICSFSRNSAELKVQSLARSESFPEVKVTLGFPLLREEKISFILQKATELGVNAFILFECDHSQRIKPSTSRFRRWEKIIIEATRQSGRLWLPQLQALCNLKELIKKPYEHKLYASVDGVRISECIRQPAKTVLMLSGPEGDFSASEHRDLKENNFYAVRLSKHILRAETASIFAAGLVNYFLQSFLKTDVTDCSG